MGRSSDQLPAKWPSDALGKKMRNWPPSRLAPVLYSPLSRGENPVLPHGLRRALERAGQQADSARCSHLRAMRSMDSSALTDSSARISTQRSSCDSLLTRKSSPPAARKA